jgi:hypothetical protein
MGDTLSMTPRVSIFLPPFCLFQRQEELIINPVTTTTLLPSGRRGFFEYANFGEPVLTFPDSHHIRCLVMIHAADIPAKLILEDMTIYFKWIKKI